jgi:hypothetical protein
MTALHMGRVGYRICRFTDVSTNGEKNALNDNCLNQNVLLQAAGGQSPNNPYFYFGSGSAATYTMRYTILFAQ